jgi:eukaryotic-like serine/threonine-protein kinase
LAKLAATPRKRSPPQVFSGTRRFEIRRELGAGAFGTVYEARNREHGALIALKALKTTQPDWIYRFKREFRLVADLSHPNIVRVFELFCEDERWYLTMELIDGVPLGAHLTRTPADLRATLAQLARGIAALHRAGCLHRDIKPSNALVETTGRVVLLDFGLTLDRHGARHTAIAGTPPYMAPELGLGDQPSEQSDWYSFGVILYEALTGELPFQGSRSEILSLKLGKRVERPSARRPGIDPALETLAMRLLSPVPSDRPPGDEVVAELYGSLAPRHRRVTANEIACAGRDRELDELDHALDASAAAGTIATVHGEPGRGKTTLLAAFAARCRQRDVQVFSGRCHEAESVPYKGLDGAVDMLAGELARRRPEEVAELVPGDVDALLQMFPVLKTLPAFARARRDRQALTPQDARRRASRALAELLRRLSERAPVALLIDDLHWAGDDCAQVLIDLLAPQTPPMLMVVAYRPQEEGGVPALDRLLRALDAHGVARRDLALEPLDAAGVASVLAARPDVIMPLELAMSETGGHPYLLGRLLQADTITPPRRAKNVVDALAAEIAALAPEVRAVLEVVALAARPLDEQTAFAAAGVARDPNILDQLRRNRLVHLRAASDDRAIDVYHARVRECTVAGMTADRQRDVHLVLAKLLERALRIEPEVVAHHYGCAGERALARQWTRRAAKAAASALAFAHAAELLDEAARLADDERERLEVLKEQAEALLHTGQRAAGADALLSAEALARRLGDVDAATALRARAGQGALLGGDVERGLGLLREVLVEVGGELPGTADEANAAAEALCAQLRQRGLAFERRAVSELDADVRRRVDVALAVAGALALSEVRAAAVAGRALAWALEAGEPVRVQRALALFVVGQAARAPADPLLASALELALALAAEVDDELALAWTQLAASLRALNLGELVDALEHGREAERRFLALGGSCAREVGFARLTACTACGIWGVDLMWSAAVAPELLEEATARGDVVGAAWARHILCWVSLAAGDVAAARQHLEARLRFPEAPQSPWAHLDELVIAAYEASSREASARLLKELERAPREGDPAELIAASLRHALAGDRERYGDELARCRKLWAERKQQAYELAAHYRLCELEGDEEGRLAAADELRALGVAEPERFATLIVGPIPA